jgi:hypothetical protein
MDYLVLIAHTLIPYLPVAGIYFVLLRVAGRSKSPAGRVFFHSLIGSAVITGMFSLWLIAESMHSGSTARALSLLFVPLYTLGVALVSFLASWIVVFAAHLLHPHAKAGAPRDCSSR